MTVGDELVLMRACVLIVAAVALAACQNGDPAKTVYRFNPEEFVTPSESYIRSVAFDLLSV